MSSLHNKKVLVTREISQAESLTNLIEEYNGTAIVVPLISIECFKDIQINLLEKKYEWIFFTSVNGVRCFMEQYRDEISINEMKIAAVGHKTANKIKQYGCDVHFIPTTYNAETLAKEFFRQNPNANHFLIVRGNISRNVLLEAFQEKNVLFEPLVVYETKSNLFVKDELIHIMENEQLDYLTFTSPSTIITFVQLLAETNLLDKVRQLPTICIGTTTEKEARLHQFTTVVTPESFTIEGMVQALVNFENMRL